MKRHYKKVFISMVLICISVFGILIYNTIRDSNPSIEVLQRDITTNQVYLEAFLEKIQNKSIDVEDIIQRYNGPWKKILTSIYEQDFTYYFCLKSQHPEKSRMIVFSKSKPVFMGIEFVFQDNSTIISVNNLGINGKGYIKCHMILENWYYLESYLPT